MDFSVFNVGGIDFSPAPWICRHTLVLDEPELASANHDQYDRFWRVWHSKRSMFAPSLVDLTLVLRPGFAEGKMTLTGINQFLEFYHTYVEPNCDTTGLHIYLDCYTAIVAATRYQVLEEPRLLKTIPPPAHVWPPTPTHRRRSFPALQVA